MPRTETGKRHHAAMCDFPMPHGCANTLGIDLIEAEAAALERARLGAIIERNHGERGHPRPFVECVREVCVLGWSLADPEP